MRILVTGAEGFIGSALVAALGSAHEVRGTDRGDGDIADPGHVAGLFERRVDRIFHLAGLPSGATEANYAAGHRVNVESTTLLLRQCRMQVERAGRCRASSTPARSRCSAFPCRPASTTRRCRRPPSATVRRSAPANCSSTTRPRRGDVDGRSLRLAGVVVRRAAPNGALSAFNSDLLREPLSGRDYVCPVGPEATIWITSLRTAVANLLQLAEVDTALLGADRAVTAPALAVSVADIVAAIGRVDAAAAARVRYEPRPQMEAQFARWPLDCAFARAEALGLRTDESLDALVQAFKDSLAP
jgi:nucleoside-diphosphate-sugar epimerase